MKFKENTSICGINLQGLNTIHIYNLDIMLHYIPTVCVTIMEGCQEMQGKPEKLKITMVAECWQEELIKLDHNCLKTHTTVVRVTTAQLAFAKFCIWCHPWMIQVSSAC